MRYGIDYTFASKPENSCLMKNLMYFLLCDIIIVALVVLTSCGRQDECVSIVPAPVCMEQHTGCFPITESTCISVDHESQTTTASLFAHMFEKPAGFVPNVCKDCPKADIRLHTDCSMKDESYRLYVRSEGIDIYASGSPGFYYALQTVRQVLPAEIESDVLSPDVKWEVPLMTVYDEPRFEYRGLMVDVSRYFLEKDSLLEIIDCMSMLKLNNLHLHLTDDNGWRIEIKKYPLLTSVGAWRVDRGDVPFPDRHNPQEGEPTPIGGYYTQDDIREIVDYAARRQVNVIPEIDMPAHSNSALAAYPQYACPNVDKFIGVLPGLGGPNADIIYCAGNDDVLVFLKNVIDEVCELFPSRYIHLGGDEAWKTYWKTCELCQNRIRQEGLEDEEALQGWFMSQMNDYLKDKGRVMMGWDEMTLGGVPEGAVVFGWRGNGYAALEAAGKGHDFVMTPSQRLYLIRYQGPQWFEPLTYFGNSTLQNVYEYEPVGQDWSSEYQDGLMGIQGSMWTEFCDCPEDVTYQIFPRLAAVAEVAWTPSAIKDWRRFLKSLDAFNSHLDHKGVVYAKSMYNIQHNVRPVEDGLLAVSLKCERPDVDIRYTTDGSDPHAASPVFREDISVDAPVVIKAATFFTGGSRAGKVLELPIGRNKATACRVYSGQPSAGCMVNGVRGSLKQTDFEWCHFYDDATIVVDLGKVTKVGEVAVGALTNYGMAFNKPAGIIVSLSSDGKNYSPAGRKTWCRSDIFCQGNFIEDLDIEFPSRPARYVKLRITHPGVCPKGHIREGQSSKYCFDEIVVREGTLSLVDGDRLCRPPHKLYGERHTELNRSQKDLFKWSDAGGL